MAKRDYYEILGVSKNTDETELKKAYRKMAVIIPIKTPTTKKRKRNSKKQPKHMIF